MNQTDSAVSDELRRLVLGRIQGAKKRGAIACIALAALALAADIVLQSPGDGEWHWHPYTFVIVALCAVAALVFARAARSVPTTPGLRELLGEPRTVVRIVEDDRKVLRLLLRSGAELRLLPGNGRARLLELLRAHSPAADLTSA